MVLLSVLDSACLSNNEGANLFHEIRSCEAFSNCSLYDDNMKMIC
jgi:hypothetical protein